MRGKPHTLCSARTDTDGLESTRSVPVLDDANFAIARTLVAAKVGVRVAHVEALTRCFERTKLEEINRLVTDRISDLLLHLSLELDTCAVIGERFRQHTGGVYLARHPLPSGLPEPGKLSFCNQPHQRRGGTGA